VAGVARRDHARNGTARSKLEVQSLLNNIDEYRTNWLNHVQRLEGNRLPKLLRNINQKGKYALEDVHRDGETKMRSCNRPKSVQLDGEEEEEEEEECISVDGCVICVRDLVDQLVSCKSFHVPYCVLGNDFSLLKFWAKVALEKGVTVNHVVTPHICKPLLVHSLNYPQMSVSTVKENNSI
jgi:hypothetical protein